MTMREVHWHEGMFLRPHHLQASSRYLQEVARTGDKWNLHHGWGIRLIELDRDALSNYRFVVHTLRARLRDGTLVNVPEDGQLPVVELRPLMERNPTLTISLAVPTLRLGKANLSAESPEARYKLQSQEIEDENTGLNPQLIQTRLLNLRLVTNADDTRGLETLELAQVSRSADAEGRPTLAPAHIPPLLACDAWQPLMLDIVQSLYDRIGQKIELLANQIETRGIEIGAVNPADVVVVSQLKTLNEASSILFLLTQGQGVHPWEAYVELCRMVGQMSIWGEPPRVPRFPAYDHDNLGFCFYAVKKILDGLLDRIIEPEYKQRPFEGAGLRMQVNLDPVWLEPAYQMFVGVKSTLNPQDCVNLLTRSGMDMKIGSSSTVDMIYQRGAAGLKFTPSLQPPRALPRLQGLTYFQIDRDAAPDEWANVRNTMTLAIRLNENRVSGSIAGQRRLTIRLSQAGTQTTTMQFTLYVIKSTAT